MGGDVVAIGTRRGKKRLLCIPYGRDVLERFEVRNAREAERR